MDRKVSIPLTPDRTNPLDELWDQNNDSKVYREKCQFVLTKPIINRGGHPSFDTPFPNKHK